MVTKNIAIILARGGSKRLPKKNILKLQRKPLVAWSIEAAIKSGLFDRVLVSTDSKEIQNISKKYNADVPFLRKKLQMILVLQVLQHIMHFGRLKIFGGKNIILSLN